MADDQRVESAPNPEAVAAPQATSPTERATQLQLIQRVSSFHLGPLPDPEALRTYAELIPNGPDRIMAMVEREAAHRHEQEAQLAASKRRRFTRGQWMAFSTTFALAAAGVYLGVAGHDWLAGALFTTTIGAVMTTFLLGNSERAKREK